MTRNIYPYVDDDLFLEEVKKVFTVVEVSLVGIETDMHDNVIDPFSALFDAFTQNISYTDWIEQEKHRQLQKTLQNAIGYFHQNILGLIDDWNNPGPNGGYDVKNEKKKIIAEIKNKHNTLNAGSSNDAYRKLSDLLTTEPNGTIAYLVTIVPKRTARFDKEFVPSGNQPRSEIRTVDGATFYEIATGDRDALKLLFNSIPKAVEILKDVSESNTKSSDFMELFSKAFGE